MTHDPIRRAALDLLHRMQATGEAQDAAEADSWIVAAHDPEITPERPSFIGTFPDPVAALRFAEEWADELNRGMPPGETLYTTSIHPMMDPDR